MYQYRVFDCRQEVSIYNVTYSLAILLPSNQIVLVMGFSEGLVRDLQGSGCYGVCCPCTTVYFLNGWVWFIQ